MQGRNTKSDIQAYRPWAWVVGYAAAAILTALMFVYSGGI